MLVGSPELRESARAEVLRDLNAVKPALILVQEGDANNLYAQSSRAALADFSALSELLARDYVIAFNNASFEIYHRL